jgi:hypothetical protein
VAQQRFRLLGIYGQHNFFSREPHVPNFLLIANLVWQVAVRLPYITQMSNVFQLNSFIQKMFTLLWRLLEATEANILALYVFVESAMESARIGTDSKPRGTSHLKHGRHFVVHSNETSTDKANSVSLCM